MLVPGHSVICALGQRSRTAAVEALRDAAPYTAVIGDAVHSPMHGAEKSNPSLPYMPASPLPTM